MRLPAIAGSCMVCVATPLHAGPHGTWHLLDASPVERAHPLCVYDPVSDRMHISSGRANLGSAINDSWSLDLRGYPRWTRTSASGPVGYGSAFALDPVRNKVVSFGGRSYSNVFNSTWSWTPGSAVPWVQVSATGTIPSARSGVSGIYDSARDRMVIFGGNELSGLTEIPRNDLYSLALASNDWSAVTAAGTAPGPRTQHSAIYDAARDRMVVFGGWDGSVLSNQVWILNFSPTPQWSLVSPPGPSPSARSGAASIYDPVQDRMIVFGGNTTPHSPFDFYRTAANNLNDTWAFSLSALSWTQLVTGSSPPPRVTSCAFYDPNAERMIVFGGEDIDGGSDETWSLALSGPPNWTLMSPGKPSSRTNHSAIYVPAADQMIIFGGFGDTPTRASYYDDAFVLQLGSDRWTRLQPTGIPPPSQTQHSATYDPANQRMLVIGGTSLWSLALSGTPAWTLLSPGGTPPGSRINHSAIRDPVRNRILVFGGSGSDVRVLALGLSGPLNWQQLTVAGTPPAARSGHAAIYDPVRDRMILFGGADSETWALQLSGTPTWSRIVTAGTPPTDRIDGTGVYDSLRDRFVYFGGRYTNYQSNGTYALPLSGTPTWSPLAPTGSFPRGRSGAVGIYDPVRDRMVIHGGQYDGGVSVHDTHDTAYELEWGDVVSVPAATQAGSGASIELVRPNPGRDTQTFEINLSTRITSGDIEVLTVTGQRVWSRNLRALPSGRHVIRWDGRRGDGARVAPGVYLIRLHIGGVSNAKRFVRID